MNRDERHALWCTAGAYTIAGTQWLVLWMLLGWPGVVGSCVGILALAGWALWQFRGAWRWR